MSNHFYSKLFCVQVLCAGFAVTTGCDAITPQDKSDGGVAEEEKPADALVTDDDNDNDNDNDNAQANTGSTPQSGVVFVTLFTHIEDNTPPGPLGTPTNRQAYDRLRTNLIEVASRAQALGLPFVLQPDWKILEASLLYEEGTLLDSSNGKNLYRYLHEDLGVTIDPHAHESGAYNYTDVAYLLEQLGVGGSTVIGGHIWDPSLPQFQEWDRFRTPQPGSRFPEHLWRGDILIGAGTPNHVNDPDVSGVWRPRDRDHFFEDDPAGNIIAVGAWKDDVDGVSDLIALYESGTVPPSTLLTAYWNIPPAEYDLPGGPEAVSEKHFEPLLPLVEQGLVQVTDFQHLVATWASDYDAQPGPYTP
ncbi:MAG: hypothetical protein ACO3JL_05355 [Myxococcota bacterium]